MTRTLALVLALVLTGIPSFAAEFAELPAGAPIRLEMPMNAAAGVETANLSIPAQAQLPAAAQGVVIPEISIVSAALAAKALPEGRQDRALPNAASPRAELASADKGGAVAFAALADGGKPSAPSAEAVSGATGAGLFVANLSGYSGEGRYSPREPRRPDRREDNALSRAWQWVKGVPDGWKIGVAAAVIIGGTLFGFYEHSKAWNEYWLKSKSQHQIVQIEESRRSGDAATLLDVAKTAEERQQRMQQRIAAAKDEKQKRVDDKTHDTVKQAEALESFDGLVWSRARLNHNFVSQDPAARLGEQTPRTWTGREQDLERDALATGFEGNLALSLKDLQAEVGREKGSATRIDGQLRNFDKHVPSLFGGVMAGEFKKGQADLKEFQDQEIAPEDNLFAAENGRMRDRVSDRLYSERQEFHGHRDHRDRLITLFDAKVDPAYKTAEQIDSDLASMISHRNQEATWMAVAAMHTHDAVEHSETTYDSKGNAHTRTWTTYEDHSGTYRALAAMEASEAASAARSANSGLERLKPMIAALYADKTLNQEQLTALLPRAEGQRVGEGGFDVFSDLLLHPLFGIFGSLSSASSGSSARAQFGPVLGSLKALDGEVAGRRDVQIRWVEGQITADLDSQMAKAKEQAALMPEMPDAGKDHR